MSEEKWTPGPWEWYGPTRGEGLTFTHEAHVGPGEGNDSCGPIAAVSGDDDEQAVANARLIASAPDLLAACEAGGRYSDALKRFQEAGRFGEVVTSDELDSLFADWHDKTHAAIAKARGTSPQE